MSTVLAGNPGFFTNCSPDETKRWEQAFDFAEPKVMFDNGTRIKLRVINCSRLGSLQYSRHEYREIIMKSIGELVCVSLIVLSFAAILYLVPF